MSAYETWWILPIGLGTGLLWTFGSLLWALTSDQLLAPHSPVEWLHGLILRPALVSVSAGGFFYRSGVATEALGVIAGLAFAVSVCTGLLVIAAKKV